MLSHYLSKTLLSILAVPNKTEFSTNLTLTVIPSMSTHLLKPLLMHPRAHATTGATSTLYQRPKPFQLSLHVLMFFNLSNFFFAYSKITWNSSAIGKRWNGWDRSS